MCETCFGPLVIIYDYDAIGNAISREKIASRDRNLWRYRAAPHRGRTAADWYALGIYAAGESPSARGSFGSPGALHKDDSVNHPTFSYKDRVVSVNFDQLYQDLNPPIVKAAGT